MYTVEGSMFEGLFLRALRVDPGSELAEELRRVGFDVRHVEARYDISVWVASVEAAWRQLHPESGRDEAWRRLGRSFIEGYFQTAIGAIIAAALPFMAASRFLERVPFFMRTGLRGSFCEVDFPRPQHAALRFHGPHARSAFLMVGVLEVCFERLGHRITCAPRELSGVDSLLEVRWESG